MKINIASVLRNEGSTMDLVLCEELSAFETVVDSVLPDGPVEFKGMIENDKGLLVLKGTLNVGYKAVCGRCLCEVEGSLTLPVHEELHDAESDPDEYVFTYSQEHLDPEEILFGYVSLNLPMKVLCSHDCKGICLNCGVNLNEKRCSCSNEDDVNPEMDKLKGFFLRNE